MAGLFKDVAFIFRLLFFAFRLFIAALVYAGRALLLVVQVARSIRLLLGGLACPRGHPVPTEGGVFTCAGCGFTYEGGSQWLCPNPECTASTPYVNCPTCGLSVPSPYRFLHQ
jgi:hypothetical protein